MLPAFGTDSARASITLSASTALSVETAPFWRKARRTARAPADGARGAGGSDFSDMDWLRSGAGDAGRRAVEDKMSTTLKYTFNYAGVKVGWDANEGLPREGSAA